MTAVLHTILFSRIFKHDQMTFAKLPSSTSSILYCKLGSEDIERQVDAAISTIISEHLIESGQSCTTNVLLYDKREKKNWLGGSQPPSSNHIWEKWSITVRTVESNSQSFDGMMRDALLYIASARCTHLPCPVDCDPYPFRIQIESSANIAHHETLTSLFKKILTESNIPPLLG